MSRKHACFSVRASTYVDMFTRKSVVFYTFEKFNRIDLLEITVMES